MEGVPHKYKPQPNKEKPKHQINFDKVINLPFIRGFSKVYMLHKSNPQPNKEKPKHQIDFDKVIDLLFIRGFSEK